MAGTTTDGVDPDPPPSPPNLAPPDPAESLERVDPAESLERADLATAGAMMDGPDPAESPARETTEEAAASPEREATAATGSGKDQMTALAGDLTILTPPARVERGLRALLNQAREVESPPREVVSPPREAESPPRDQVVTGPMMANGALVDGAPADGAAAAQERAERDPMAAQERVERDRMDQVAHQARAEREATVVGLHLTMDGMAMVGTVVTPLERVERDHLGKSRFIIDSMTSSHLPLLLT